MPSQSSGPLTTFLMFVPLVAVPALAVFGVPEFKPIASLSQNSDSRPVLGQPGGAEQLMDQPSDDLISPVRNDIRQPDANGSYETSARGPALPPNESLHHVNGRSRAASNRGISDSTGDRPKNWSPPAHVLHEWDTSPSDRDGKTARAASNDRSAQGDFDPDRPAAAEASKDEEASPFRPFDELAATGTSEDAAVQSKSANGSEGDAAKTPQRNERPSPEAASRALLDDAAGDQFARDDDHRAEARSQVKDEATDESLTFKTAVKRLKALGIRDFTLQPGENGNEFHFSCCYAAPDQPRVTRRFEAEAPEPLQAVRQVLAQVESLSGK